MKESEGNIPREKKYAYGYYLQFSENSKDKEHDLIIYQKRD